VEHVRGGQAEVDPATGLTGGGGKHVDERGHVVVDLALALAHRLHREGRVADRLELSVRRALARAEQVSELLARGDLDAPPALHARLIAPDACQLRARVAIDHAVRICAARIAALRALSNPTHATGTPGGICTIERIASSPPAALRRPDSGTPMTGRSVCAATAPGRAAEMPAPAMITRSPRMCAFFE